ncbi:M15 family metallopeptidase [Comamonas sp. NLF-1-9]|uniref:M15 family metallopeptidase n=1 Tax=Comamonas sp. NLF-1-9 TaxID=2853163 RepID=UPI001C47A10B|nr:M15 family metallopeptidase [Comamonas sp. NLF-1-9]QXL83847.1 M15 family metallopeptidase [Comamonas sp. NLF-1-9]
MPHLFRSSIAAALLAGLLGACAAPSVTSSADAASAGNLVALAPLAPTVVQDMRYFGPHNFVGRPIAGYEAPQCWLSQAAAQALARVQQDLAPHGLGLKVFDCYRPQQAVDDFVRWGADLADQRTKAEYYPRVPKSELFARGYIAEKSGHSRASTADLTLIVHDAARAARMLQGPLAAGHEVDMGSPFDLFDEQSHTEYAGLSAPVRHNRLWLRALMQQHGWRNLPEEWWHYTLVNEPWPERYFNVPVR